MAKRSKSKGKGPSLKKLMSRSSDDGKAKPTLAQAIFPHLPSVVGAATAAMKARRK